MVFIGYEPGSKAWQLYDPMTRWVHVSRDAIFEEDRAWTWSTENISAGTPVHLEYVIAGAGMDTAWSGATPFVPTFSSPARSTSRSAAMPTRRSEPLTSPVPEALGAIEQGSPSASSPNLNIDTDDVPLKLRAMDDILGPT
jgi:hypothetical protein